MQNVAKLKTAGETFVWGLKDSAPILLGALPFALIIGISAVSVGLPSFEAVMMSVIVYAGAAQLVALQLIAEQAPIVVIWLSTLVINMRFLMYSLSLLPHVKGLSFWKRLLMTYVMTDQSYAFSINRFSEDEKMPHKYYYYMGTAVGIAVVWVCATTVGALVGATVPESWSLSFAVPLMFMALLAPNIKDNASLMAALAAGITAVIARPLPFNLGLILAALLGITIAMLIENRQLAKQNLNQDPQLDNEVNHD